MNAPRLRLKHAAGWFAAGGEVMEAMHLLSDAAFKVFVWLCLHAERDSGRLLVEAAAIARAVGKDEAAIHEILRDLFQAEICHQRPAATWKSPIASGHTSAPRRRKLLAKPGSTPPK